MTRPKKKNTSPAQSMQALLNRAVTLFDTPYDDRDGVRSADLPSLRFVADEMGTTILRARKLLITADYFTTSTSRQIQRLIDNGCSVEDVMEQTGLGRASVYSYTLYKNLAFNLEETTVNADRHRLFRKRVKAVAELQKHIGLPDESEYLWKAIIAFEEYPFKTLGRGKNHAGATKFKYTVSRTGGDGGRHYQGVSVDGYGNEMWIMTDGVEKEKSISRSTVELAFKNALEEQQKAGCVSGPRKLGVPGSRSYLYAMFLRFSVITQEKEECRSG